MQTIEQELLLREFQHKVVIIGAKIAQDYIKEQTNGVGIPHFIAEQQAIAIVPKTIHSYLVNGTLNHEYEKAWEELKEQIPDNYSSCI